MAAAPYAEICGVRASVRSVPTSGDFDGHSLRRSFCESGSRAHTVCVADSAQEKLVR